MSARVEPFRASADGPVLGYAFECPGCAGRHAIPVLSPYRDGWKFNGDLERPSFEESIRARWTYGEEQTPHVCHSLVRDGRIQFLSDCTHALAGQTVELSPLSGEA